MIYKAENYLRRFEEHTPKLGDKVFVDPSAVVIGDVEIGADSSIWPNTTVRGDMHRIRIGARSSIQDNSILHITHAGPYNPEGYPLTIGDEVTVAHSVTSASYTHLLAHESSLHLVCRLPLEKKNIYPSPS